MSKWINFSFKTNMLLINIKKKKSKVTSIQKQDSSTKFNLNLEKEIRDFTVLLRYIVVVVVAAAFQWLLQQQLRWSQLLVRSPFLFALLCPKSLWNGWLVEFNASDDGEWLEMMNGILIRTKEKEVDEDEWWRTSSTSHGFPMMGRWPISLFWSLVKMNDAPAVIVLGR